jgi:hypothetical protein
MAIERLSADDRSQTDVAGTKEGEPRTVLRQGLVKAIAYFDYLFVEDAIPAIAL